MNHRIQLAVYRHFTIVQETSFAYEMLKSLYEGVIVTIKNREEKVKVELQHVKFKFFQSQVVNLANSYILNR